jgi:hypothetical protein
MTYSLVYCDRPSVTRTRQMISGLCTSNARCLSEYFTTGGGRLFKPLPLFYSLGDIIAYITHEGAKVRARKTRVLPFRHTFTSDKVVLTFSERVLEDASTKLRSGGGGFHTPLHFSGVPALFVASLSFPLPATTSVFLLSS